MEVMQQLCHVLNAPNTTEEQWSKRDGAGQCPDLQTQSSWSRGVSEQFLSLVS